MQAMLDARLEPYMKSILDYYRLLEEPKSEAQRKKIEEVREKFPITLDLGDYNL